MSENVIFENNPEFNQVFESKIHGLKFYMPTDISNGYHISRFVAGGAQDIFSNAGTTKEYLREVANQVMDWCNNAKISDLRTNIGTMMDNLLYRLQYPVDEYCLLRMGALFCFIEGENPNEVKDFWTQKKMELALGSHEKNISSDPDMYAFFLSMGIPFTPSYKESLNILEDMNYLKERAVILQSLIPEVLRNK